MSMQRFSGTMLLTGNNTGIEVPVEIVEALGGGRRPAVLVRVNGYEYRSTVVVMGGKHLIPFSSETRAATGISGGDAIEVELELDTRPRTVAVPEDLAAALAGAGLTEAFERIAPSRKKAHVLAVESAKAPETRQRRIEAIVTKTGG
jgi:hypothetical protein